MNTAFPTKPQFHVQEGTIGVVVSPISPRQMLEKTFTVVDPSVGAKIAPVIRHLLVKTPGVTFVSFNAAATTPSIRVSSEFSQALEAFQVIAHNGGGLEIRLRHALERQYILTEVVLPTANMLLSLDVTGSGTVVVQDNVLVAHDPQADIRIKVVGSGDALVTTHTATMVRSFSLEVSGSGDVQFVAPAITAVEGFSVQLTSSGDLRVFTSSVTAPHANIDVRGSGDVQLAALGVEVSKKLGVAVSGSGNATMIGDQLTANLVDVSVTGSGDAKVVLMNALSANRFDASVAGSGRVEVASRLGHCDESSLTVTGSGSVDARDLVARHANVQITGSGSATFRASEAANTYVGGSGSAKIVGQLPPRVTGRPKVKAEDEKPSRVEHLGSKRRTPVPEPTKVDAFEKMTGFNGSYHVTSFSEFINGIKAMWHGTANKVIFKWGNVSCEP